MKQFTLEGGTPAFVNVFGPNGWVGTEEDLAALLGAYTPVQVSAALFPDGDVMSPELDYYRRRGQDNSEQRGLLEREIVDHLRTDDFRSAKVKVGIYEQVSAATNSWHESFSKRFARESAAIVAGRAFSFSALSATEPWIESFINDNGRERYRATSADGSIVCGHEHRLEINAKACLKRVAGA
jgi:hypothetical protein